MNRGHTLNRPHSSVIGASLVVLVTFGVSGGLAGLLIGLAVLGVSLLSSSLGGFVVGSVLVLLLDVILYGFEMLIVSLGLVTLVLASVLAEGLPPTDAVIGALAFLGFSSLGFLVLEVADSLVVATVILVGSIALVLYGLHRYELVELGLVEEASG